MSDNKEEMTVIVFRSTFTDWLLTTWNFVMVTGMAVANHRWGGGSTWIDALAVILMFTSLVAIGFRKHGNSWRGTVSEAIAHLKQINKE